MKPRHFYAGLALAVFVAGMLVSCLPAGMSIKERVSSLQDDMNTTTRSNVYKDFHSTESLSYAALRGDPSPFNLAYPPPGTAYSLSVVDDSNASAVIVVVNSGPNSGAGYTAPYYLQFQMDKDGVDYAIVKMYDSQTNGSYQLRFQ